ncbi:MAG: hypothetical protein ACRC91_05925 [Aeromonas sp.]
MAYIFVGIAFKWFFIALNLLLGVLFVIVCCFLGGGCAFRGDWAMGVHFVSVVISPSWHAPYNRICLSLGYIYWLSLDY